MDNEFTEKNEECVCGRSTDGRCHCCNNSMPVVDDEEINEYVESLEDWD